MDFEIYQIRGSSTVYKLFFLFVCLFKKKNQNTKVSFFFAILNRSFPQSIQWPAVVSELLNRIFTNPQNYLAPDRQKECL